MNNLHFFRIPRTPDELVALIQVGAACHAQYHELPISLVLCVNEATPMDLFVAIRSLWARRYEGPEVGECFRVVEAIRPSELLDAIQSLV